MGAVALHHEINGALGTPPVLLLNSLGATLRMWDPQVPALAERCFVVTCDTRGHGESPVPPGPYEIDDLVDDVIALLDNLDIGRSHIAGLSLGGMVAMRLAARNPERVERLALLCTSAQLGPPQTWAERAATVLAEGDRGRRRQRRCPLVDRSATRRRPTGDGRDTRHDRSHSSRRLRLLL